MKTICEAAGKKRERPIRVVQFGEGNFLRAFADDMIDIANEKGVFDGSIAIVKPRPGSLERFEKQNCLYTVILRGLERGKVINRRRIVTSVAAALGYYENTDAVMALARLGTLRFVVSNTTEAGIVLREDDHFDGVPESFPGKLAKFLYERYTAFGGAADKGLIVLPAELIENNGKTLREYVLKLAAVWGLPAAFGLWVENACVFCNTLVDRIVTGYPAGEAGALGQTLGYTDELLTVGEPFGLWVIESEKDISGEFPLDQAGLPVLFTNDLTPYRTRKVRVLNGAHTASVPAAYLCGHSIVRACMHDEVMGRFIRLTVLREIVPEVPLPREETEAFAASVFERFENPFIDHALLAISLNSVSKWKTRVLPSLLDSLRAGGRLPKLLTFSFAALLAFYTSDRLMADGLHAMRQDGEEYVIRDGADVLAFFAANSTRDAADFVCAAAAREDFWGMDLTALPDFTDTVTRQYIALRTDAAAACRAVLEDRI